MLSIDYETLALVLFSRVAAEGVKSAGISEIGASFAPKHAYILMLPPMPLHSADSDEPVDTDSFPQTGKK